MNLFADIVILAILFFGTYFGYKKGFILTFFNFFSGLFSMIIASVFAHPVGDFLARTFIKPVLTGLYSNGISERLTACAEGSNPIEAISSYVNRFGVSANDLQILWERSANSLEKFSSLLVNRIVSLVAETVGYSLSLVLIFILAFASFKVLVSVLDLVAKLPILNISNHSLGLLLGFLHGCFVAFVFVAVLVVFEPLFQSLNFPLFSEFTLEKTYLTRLFLRLICL